MTLAEVTIPEAVTIAEDAYVFAYPLLRTSRALTATNRLVQEPERPDTLRFSAWLDLGTEPIVLTTPDTRGRYYALWLRDAWNTMFASAGARTTGTGSRAFAILGPGRHGANLPPGLTPVAAPTRIVHVSGCIEALGEPGRDDIAAGFRITPLSRRHNPGVGTPAASIVTAPASGEPIERLDARSFFAEAFRLIADNPPEPGDREGLERLKALAPLGDAAVWQHLEPELQAALERGVARGRVAVRAVAARTPGERVGPWRVSYDGGRYGSDYLRRAGVACAGTGAQPAADELPAVLETDAEGRPLTGGERYVLRFAPDATPPVNGFWSLTTYAVDDPASSWNSTGDLRGLTLDHDGSLPIHIQHSRPARARRANWLPAPAGRFTVVLRLYWPREEALRGEWSPPTVTRL